eukprot:TRINITY_DN51830_c0_g2_i3.p1 TRINITY_DN51830_c0_g2~~TRINITY_DN51830_c0_g2_i3.p1  ORF type:complete len:104 (-),score=16.22 TRINITY_DN51830_c0_g2_i3:15-326(-)
MESGMGRSQCTAMGGREWLNGGRVEWDCGMGCSQCTAMGGREWLNGVWNGMLTVYSNGWKGVVEWSVEWGMLTVYNTKGKADDIACWRSQTIALPMAVNRGFL